MKSILEQDRVGPRPPLFHLLYQKEFGKPHFLINENFFPNNLVAIQKKSGYNLCGNNL